MDKLSEIKEERKIILNRLGNINLVGDGKHVRKTNGKFLRIICFWKSHFPLYLSVLHITDVLDVCACVDDRR